MGARQVQATAVLCVGCEAAADPEVCVVFNAVPGLGGKVLCLSLFQVSPGEGGEPSPSPLLLRLPFLSAAFAIAAFRALPLND